MKKQFRVVADSSCLIGLAKVKRFEILRHTFSEIFIPEAVYYEVVVKGKGELGSEDTEAAIKEGWILKREVNDKIAVKALSSILGKGESEAIILSKELDADYAVIDEKIAREQAELMEVNVIGILGILDLAIEQGISIDKRELINQLREEGFRISERLYKRIFPD